MKRLAYPVLAVSVSYLAVRCMWPFFTACPALLDASVVVLTALVLALIISPTVKGKRRS